MGSVSRDDDIDNCVTKANKAILAVLRFVVEHIIFVFHDEVIKKKTFLINGPLCGNSSVTGEFPSQGPVTRSLDASYDRRLNERLSEQ